MYNVVNIVILSMLLVTPAGMLCITYFLYISLQATNQNTVILRVLNQRSKYNTYLAEYRTPVPSVPRTNGGIVM